MKVFQIFLIEEFEEKNFEEEDNTDNASNVENSTHMNTRQYRHECEM